MKKLDLHWKILIGMLFGLVFGFVIQTKGIANAKNLLVQVRGSLEPGAGVPRVVIIST